MYVFDCEYCDSSIEAEAVESVKARAKAHSEARHRDSVVADLHDRHDGIECRNDCGYTFPVGVENVAGLDCPECGHDNLSPLLEQYVFWRISAESE